MGNLTNSINRLANENDTLTPEEAEKIQKEALASAKQFIDIAKHEMNNTEDEAYRMELQKCIDEVERGNLYFLLNYLFFLFSKNLIFIIHNF